MTALTEFRITFGAEPHALFPEARPDSWVTILAPDWSTARLIAINHLGTQGCDMYGPDGVAEIQNAADRSWAEMFPGRELARWSSETREDDTLLPDPRTTAEVPF